MLEEGSGEAIALLSCMEFVHSYKFVILPRLNMMPPSCV